MQITGASSSGWANHAILQRRLGRTTNGGSYGTASGSAYGSAAWGAADMDGYLVFSGFGAPSGMETGGQFYSFGAPPSVGPVQERSQPLETAISRNRGIRRTVAFVKLCIAQIRSLGFPVISMIAPPAVVPAD
ncbi:MAG: hypothetical protein R3C24_01695 [Cyanobacteriota/Melainabacteria group bacterium]